MTQIALYALFILRDGELELSFHHTEEERSAAVRTSMAEIARSIGRSAAEFTQTVELEERYEQATGKQLEFLTEDVTVPVTHPVLIQVIALIDSAMKDLKSSANPPYVPLSYLRKAMQLLQGEA
ncbi:hypothetical protein [Paracoccus sp. TOH]|uniref:hypothetical protein n=1 Tax=Paracoccus sp. TOH TaxID=1263728 RepID=UPI0025B278EB|nr:hypothetical protein [Paracoccus sp. TOH]WJS87198.1 hypothetical protein NBE95_21490 [Paracoccus sp. TOH]